MTRSARRFILAVLLAGPAGGAAAGEIEDACSSAGAATSATPSIELADALRRLADAYSDRTGGPSAAVARRTPRYIEELEAILAMTRTGRAIQGCYAAAIGGSIFGSELVLRDELPGDDPDLTMGFFTVSDERVPGAYRMRIVFDPRMDPLVALVSYAHEKQHGCRAAEQAADLARVEPLRRAAMTSLSEHTLVGAGDRYERARRARAELAPVEAVFDRNRAADEVRAYAAEAAFFAELAAAAPSVACTPSVWSGRLGRRLSLGEYFTSQERSLTDGTFPRTIVARYVETGVYQRDYVLNEDGSLHPELAERLAREGYAVAR